MPLSRVLARWLRVSSSRLIALMSAAVIVIVVTVPPAEIQAALGQTYSSNNRMFVNYADTVHEAPDAADLDRVAAAFLPAPSGEYLANPGIGWQESRLTGAPLLEEMVTYRRPQYGWVDQNPTAGVYNWAAVDADLQSARSKGQQFSFRIYTMQGEEYGGHHVPQWVLDKGAAVLSTGEPDYSNCVYQAEWARFVDAMRQKYDGNPDIAYIDISGYGNFNEWSWQDAQTEFEDTTLDGQARRRLADMFIGGSGTCQCRTKNGVVQSVSYNYAGFQRTQLMMPYAGIRKSSEYVAGRRPDVGIRHDCLGSKSHTDGMWRSIGAIVSSTWRRAPIVYEFCAGTACSDVVMADAKAALRQTHGSAVHDNLTGTRSATMLTDLMRDVGYRYVLQEASHPAGVPAGGPLSLTMKWANIGYAPAYPRMGQDFQLHFYLLTAGGTVVQDWALSADIGAWMPADPLPGTPPIQNVAQTITVAGSVAPGAYRVAVAITDRRTGKPIRLAITGRDAQGRYLLDELQVTTGTPGPTPTPTRPVSWRPDCAVFLPLIQAGAPYHP